MVLSLKQTKWLFACIIIVLFAIVGCSNQIKTNETTVDESQNPDAEEVLSLAPNADIFQYNNIIYQMDIDWIEEKTFTKDEQIGTIMEKNDTDTNFENNMSNQLPVGAEIYTTKEESDMFLIVETDDDSFVYYAIVEG